LAVHGIGCLSARPRNAGNGEALAAQEIGDWLRHARHGYSQRASHTRASALPQDRCRRGWRLDSRPTFSSLGVAENPSALLSRSCESGWSASTDIGRSDQIVEPEPDPEPAFDRTTRIGVGIGIGFGIGSTTTIALSPPTPKRQQAAALQSELVHSKVFDLEGGCP